MLSTQKRLTLLRHAEAQQSGINSSDFDRSLTIKGQAQAQIIGEHIQLQTYYYSVVLCSPSLRTRQTLAYLNLKNTENLFFPDMLYSGNMQDYLKIIKAHQSNSILVIGHNPTIFEMLHKLCDDEQSKFDIPFDYSPASLSMLSFAKDTDFLTLKKAQIIDLFIP